MKQLIYLLILLAAVSCSPKKLIKEVPVKEVVEHGVVAVPVDQDSITVRMVIDCLPNGTPVVRQTSSSLSSIQLSMQQYANELMLKAKSPPKQALVPYKVVTTEVPIEVPVEVKTNVLYWWQKGLMYVGALSLLHLIYLIIKLIIKIKNHG